MLIPKYTVSFVHVFIHSLANICQAFISLPIGAAITERMKQACFPWGSSITGQTELKNKCVGKGSKDVEGGCCCLWVVHTFRESFLDGETYRMSVEDE